MVILEVKIVKVAGELCLWECERPLGVVRTCVGAYNVDGHNVRKVTLA